MDLTQIPHHEILNRTENLARSERRITHLILWHLIEVESRRLFLELGYTSLFKYMTAHLHYSEDAAYRRIQAAKLLKKLPHLEKNIENGDLNLTQLQNVQKCLTKELENGAIISPGKTTEILEQIQNKTNFETQKILAVELNLQIQQHELVKPQRDDSIRMELTFTEEQMKQLQHARELLSHILPNPNWADLISYLATAQIQKRLGKPSTLGKNAHEFEENELRWASNGIQTEFASQAEAEITDPIEPGTQGQNKSKNENPFNKRKSIQISIRRTLLKRAQHQCEYSHSKTGRCQSKYQLQIDHKVPLALGGTHEISNFRVLCRKHNLAEARRVKISSR